MVVLHQTDGVDPYVKDLPAPALLVEPVLDRDGFGGAGQGSGPATVEIMHADSVVRTLKGPAEAGMNRTTWGLERTGIIPPDADEDDDEPGGPEVLPGTYQVRITVGDFTADGEVTVLPDPRSPMSVAMVQKSRWLVQYVMSTPPGELSPASRWGWALAE